MVDPTCAHREFFDPRSLTRFLFDGRHGKYAAGYKRLIATDGSVENFESAIGPVEKVQQEWYGYLRSEIAAVSGQDRPSTPVASPEADPQPTR
jgi:hypothetical protein